MISNLILRNSVWKTLKGKAIRTFSCHYSLHMDANDVQIGPQLFEQGVYAGSQTYTCIHIYICIGTNDCEMKSELNRPDVSEGDFEVVFELVIPHLSLVAPVKVSRVGASMDVWAARPWVLCAQKNKVIKTTKNCKMLVSWIIFHEQPSTWRQYSNQEKIIFSF